MRPTRFAPCQRLLARHLLDPSATAGETTVVGRGAMTGVGPGGRRGLAATRIFPRAFTAHIRHAGSVVGHLPVVEGLIALYRVLRLVDAGRLLTGALLHALLSLGRCRRHMTVFDATTQQGPQQRGSEQWLDRHGLLILFQCMKFPALSNSARKIDCNRPGFWIQVLQGVTNRNSPSAYTTSRPTHVMSTCGNTAEGLRSSRSRVEPWDRRPPMRAITARAAW